MITVSSVSKKPRAVQKGPSYRKITEKHLPKGCDITQGCNLVFEGSRVHWRGSKAVYCLGASKPDPSGREDGDPAKPLVPPEQVRE
jgi:hypothetical protein